MREFPPILTAPVARQLLAAASEGAPTATASVDLGRSETVVELAGGSARIGSTEVGAAALARIAGSDGKCFECRPGACESIVVYSETTHWSRSLVPTEDAPTTLVAGFPMHRVQGTTPMRDTRAKVRALGPVRGPVLDTATGLGYTALELARQGAEVSTVELDPAAIALARRNPWSAELFENPAIRLLEGDVCELVRGFAPTSFAAVLHDPPTLRLAGDLYSAAFYRELRRVLRPGGRLFHYVGDPASRASGRTTQGVLRRLAEAGFTRARRRPAAHGVSAVAGRH